MKRICAWCNKYLGYIETPNTKPNDITHGICDRCAKNFLHNIAPTKIDFFQGVTLPAVVIQGDLHIRCANQQACDLLRQPHSQIIGMYAGDAINCINSKKNGGCSKTAFCCDCNIRESILKTLTTAQPCNAIAYPDIHSEDGLRTLRISISTQKLQDCLLLCIEDSREVTAP